MILKIYISAWLLGLITAVTLFLTGNLTSTLIVLFGFFTFAALFLGFLSVIPMTVFHSEPKEH